MHGMVAFAEITEAYAHSPPRARGQDRRRTCGDSLRRQPNESIEPRTTNYAGHARLGTCSRDPIGYEGSEWNLYAYCDSQPLTRLDPTGLFSPPPIPAAPHLPPGPDWVWAGDPPEGGSRGGWVGPSGESVHWDPTGHPPAGPHWDWNDPYGNKWRFDPAKGLWFPDKKNNPRKPQPEFPPGTLAEPPKTVYIPIPPGRPPTVPTPEPVKLPPFLGGPVIDDNPWWPFPDPSDYPTLPWHWPFDEPTLPVFTWPTNGGLSPIIRTSPIRCPAFRFPIVIP